MFAFATSALSEEMKVALVMSSQKLNHPSETNQFENQIRIQAAEFILYLQKRLQRISALNHFQDGLDRYL